MGAPPNVGVAPGNSPGFYFAEPDRTFWRYCFAGQALAGQLANPEIVGQAARLAKSLNAAGADTTEAHVLAHWAEDAACALLARLEGEEGSGNG